MASAALRRQLMLMNFELQNGKLLECAIGDPPCTAPVPFHNPYPDVTHSVLRVRDASPSPTPPHSGPVKVSVLNGFNGIKLELLLDSGDTIGKLKEKMLQGRPDLKGSLHLAFNGKPVLEHQRLAELNVKDSVTFIMFHRCVGG